MAACRWMKLLAQMIGSGTLTDPQGRQKELTQSRRILLETTHTVFHWIVMGPASPQL